MDLSPFGRGGSPDGLAIPFRLQLAELSQLAQSSSGLVAQLACTLCVAKTIDGQTASPEQLLRGRVRHSAVDAYGGQDGRENDATGTLNARQIDDDFIAYLDSNCINYNNNFYVNNYIVYAESSALGSALRTPVALADWLVNKRGPAAVQRGREPFRIPAVCVEHKSRRWATADHLRRERRPGQGLVRLAGESRAARIRPGESDVNQAQQSRIAQCVTSSIRPRAGTSANQPSKSNRPKRLGCPAHP
jgi:hypothetical protein